MIKVLAFPAFKNKSSNPYNSLLYTGIIDQGVEVKEFSFKQCLMLDYDLIHIHWPELYLNSHYIAKAFLFSLIFLFCLLFSKMFGKKTVWTIHNLKPHNIKYKWLNKWFWSAYLPLVDGVVSLSKANEKLFFEKFYTDQKIKRAVVHHGLYKDSYRNEISREDARKYFSIETTIKVALFVGQVKTYKNVGKLVELFNKESLSEKVLIIAGKFETEEYYNEILSAAANNPNIIIHNKFIPDDELQYYFNAADICLLPFKDIFNSGSVLLSVSFMTPVVVPFSDNFVEYSTMINGDMINTYDGEIGSQLIVDILGREKADQDISSMQSENVINDINPLCWITLQASLFDFYKVLVKG